MMGPSVRDRGRLFFVSTAVIAVEVAVIVEIIGVVKILVLHRVGAVVEQALTCAGAAGIVRGRVPTSDVIEAGFTGELAAGGAAAAPRRPLRGGRRSNAESAMAAAHHRANAAEQKRAADHACCGRCRSAEKRATLSDRPGCRSDRPGSR